MITAKTIFDRSKGSFEEWLEVHHQHIGASDAAAVMGLSRWRTPMSTYVVKKHMLPDKPETSAMRWGKILENTIRKEFPKDYLAAEGSVIDVTEDTYTYQSEEHPFMICDPDGFVTTEKGDGVGLLEIKTTTGHSAKDWADDSVPDDYFAQVQHSLFVLNLKWALVVVLLDKRLFWRFVPRRVGFIEEMLAAEKEWWELFYLRDEMPAPSGLEIDTEVLQGLYPTVADKELELPHLENIAIRYKELGEQAKAAEEERREIQQIFMQSMQDAQRAFAGKAKVSRSIFMVSRLDTEALKKEHPIICQRFMKETQQSKLTITVPKEKKEEVVA